MWKYSMEAALIGVALDLFLGDPRWLYHPVRLIGALIAGLEKILRKIFPAGRTGERAAGAVLALLVTAVFTGGSAVLLGLVWRWHPLAGLALESFWCYQLMAARSLEEESGKVFDALKKGNLEKARRAVSMIVGRDTDKLDEKGVARAAVETVAENTSDGVVAPFFYMMIGGAVGGFLYKAVNTMDSMVGYKNDRYRYFGTAAAQLDDILNFLPARLSALFLIAGAGILRLDMRQAWKIFLRDRYKHASPNSAQTESAMAGALNLRLAGDAWYFGELHRKDFIGDANREIEPEDILRAHRLMYAAEAIAVLLFSLARWVLLRALGF